MLALACPQKETEAVRKKIALFILSQALALTCSNAMCSEWDVLHQNDKSHQVVASSKNDDGGMLVVACNITTKTISIALEEPRARWQTGVPMRWITKADAGTEFVPSNGIVVAPTRIIVKAQSKLDIQTMGKARSFFMVDVGHFSRIFSAVNFKNAVDSVLHACGDQEL